MPGFSTLSNCPFNNNTIFICENYSQVRFSLMLGEDITNDAKKVILLGNALFELRLFCLCRYLATRFRSVEMGGLVTSYVTSCLILYLSFHIHNTWTVKLQANEEVH